MGNKKNVQMSGGTLHKEGANNEVRVKEYASKIIIEGAGNLVYVHKVNYVSIFGAGVKVYYKTSNTKTGQPGTKIEVAGSAVIKEK